MEQQGCQSLGPNSEFGQYAQIVVTYPRNVENCQLVPEESVEYPESKVFLGEAEILEDSDSTEEDEPDQFEVLDLVEGCLKYLDHSTRGS